MRGVASSFSTCIVRTTGLVLFFYVLTHNLNHALGLISLQAMEAGRIPFLAFWRFPPIEILFLLSIVTHFALGMRALYNRHSLRMPFWEGAQLILGLSIPPLLTLHFLGTAVAHWVFGLDDAYEETVLALASSGVLVAVQTAGLGDQQPGRGNAVAGRRNLFEGGARGPPVAPLHGGDAFADQSGGMFGAEHRPALMRASPERQAPGLTTF